MLVTKPPKNKTFVRQAQMGGHVKIELTRDMNENGMAYKNIWYKDWGQWCNLWLYNKKRLHY